MNKHFKDIAKNFLRPKHGLKDPQIMHPEREWVIGLALMVTVFLCSALWSVGVYITNRDVTVDETASGAEVTTVYRESMVKTALETFTERDAELTRLLSGAPAPVPEVVEAATSTSDGVASESEEEVVADVATSTGE